MQRDDYHIPDSSIWIELVTQVGLSDGLDSLHRSVIAGKLLIAVPDIVREEVLGTPNAFRDKNKKRLSTACKEIRAAAKHFGSDKLQRQLGEALDEFNRETTTWIEGEPERLAKVREILEHANTRTIATASETARCRAIDLALERRAPFRNKNASRDALIVLCAQEWCIQEAVTGHFHTLNSEDFSNATDPTKPHEDLAEVFNGGFKFHHGTEALLRFTDATAAVILEAQRIDRERRTCLICGESTIIEEAICAQCGSGCIDMPDHEQYFVEEAPNGQRIHSFDTFDGDTVKCSDCGGDVFSYLFCRQLCNYHEHQSQKD